MNTTKKEALLELAKKFVPELFDQNKQETAVQHRVTYAELCYAYEVHGEAGVCAYLDVVGGLDTEASISVYENIFLPEHTRRNSALH